MAYTSWRGVVGMIRPTMRPGSLEEGIRLLPEGIGVIPLFLGVYGGSESGFRKAVDAYEPLLDQLAEQEVDLISAGGEPPFMMQGVKGEAAMVRRWEKKYKIPILSTGRNAVAALKAIKAKNIIVVRATDWDRRGLIARYFTQAGFKVLGAHSLEATWEGISNVSVEQTYAFIKQAVLSHKNCGGVYTMGSINKGLRVTDMLEQDLGIPIISSAACYPWNIQKALNVRQPVEGYGRLLKELP